MKVIQKNTVTAFKALDNTIIQELLHPKNTKIELPFSLAHASLNAFEKSKPHVLHTSYEIYYIISGEGVMYIDEEKKTVGKDDTIVIPPNAKQYIKNTGSNPLNFLCIVSPEWTIEGESLCEE